MPLIFQTPDRTITFSEARTYADQSAQCSDHGNIDLWPRDQVLPTPGDSSGGLLFGQVQNDEEDEEKISGCEGRLK
jgi:hypothetical protein